MDDSTDGVTLFSGFITGIVDQYRRDAALHATLRGMTQRADYGDPLKPAPMADYNALCAFLEKQLGKAELIKAGGVVGSHAYAQMMLDGKLGRNPGPVQVLSELKRVADVMIQDPKRRGWEILEVSPASVRLRRTQSFNCVLQEGLLRSLVERTGVAGLRVNHEPCTRQGAPYCEYAVTWGT